MPVPAGERLLRCAGDLVAGARGQKRLTAAARTPAALLGARTWASFSRAGHSALLCPRVIALTQPVFADLPTRPLAGGLKAGVGGLAFLAAGFGGLWMSAPLLPLAMLLSTDCRPRAGEYSSVPAWR